MHKAVLMKRCEPFKYSASHEFYVCAFKSFLAANVQQFAVQVLQHQGGRIFDTIDHLTNACVTLNLNTLEDIALNAQEVVRGSLDDHLTSVLITAFVESRTATSTYRIWSNDMVAHIAFQTSLSLENRSKPL